MELLQLLKTAGNREIKKKGAHIFRQGQRDDSLYLIESGLLKAYYTSRDGKESIKSFITTTDIISSLTASHSETQCSFSLVCLEPTELIKMPLNVIRKYCSKDVAIANQVIQVLLNFAMKKEKREYEFLCLTAEQQYLNLVKTMPEFLEKVTQNNIASYLGVTPVGLSRIKKRLSQSNPT